jgi:hypothetical protein
MRELYMHSGTLLCFAVFRLLLSVLPDSFRMKGPHETPASLRGRLLVASKGLSRPP